jgi:hypothetical protein
MECRFDLVATLTLLLMCQFVALVDSSLRTRISSFFGLLKKEEEIDVGIWSPTTSVIELPANARNDISPIFVPL